MERAWLEWMGTSLVGGQWTHYSEITHLPILTRARTWTGGSHPFYTDTCCVLMEKAPLNMQMYLWSIEPKRTELWHLFRFFKLVCVRMLTFLFHTKTFEILGPRKDRGRKKSNRELLCCFSNVVILENRGQRPAIILAFHPQFDYMFPAEVMTLW